MRSCLLLFCLLLLSAALRAQPDANLASQYFQNGEFEKASVLYEKLWKQSPKVDFYFTYYIRCLVEMDRFEDAVDVLKKRIKQENSAGWLYVELGYVHERANEPDKAKAQYEKAIELLPADQAAITKLANTFTGNLKYDLAAKTYEKGNQLFGAPSFFAFELGDIYRAKGDTQKMIESYLACLKAQPSRLTNVQYFFSRGLDKESYEMLFSQLFALVQSDPENTIWPEMLAWAYLQQKDYRNAFKQVIALDRRLQENGGRVFKIARTAQNERDFPAAIEGYSYIVEKKGNTCPFYYDARREILNCRRTQLTAGYLYSREELLVLEKDYESFLEEFGRSKNTAALLSELAELEAFHLNNLPKAIATMLAVTEMNFGMATKDRLTLAEAKLALGDYYLMSGDAWEATLLYSQVDKAHKEDEIGERARFKNAKLSYYMGDFEWSQGQLDALKASTSELISNDAIDLSVFIMDHYGLDTIPTPMEMFARADLLNFQNRFDEAFGVLDSIQQLFPNHTLLDAILFTKADVHAKRREYALAQPLLEKITTDFPESIYLDNALFRLAELYENENQLNDREKAKALYEKIVLEHSGSLFVIEARKHYRLLRGDNLDGVQ
jgi:tetratricopeptide (TPR) repeat protein